MRRVKSLKDSTCGIKDKWGFAFSKEARTNLLLALASHCFRALSSFHHFGYPCNLKQVSWVCLCSYNVNNPFFLLCLCLWGCIHLSSSNSGRFDFRHLEHWWLLRSHLDSFRGHNNAKCRFRARYHNNLSYVSLLNMSISLFNYRK